MNRRELLQTALCAVALAGAPACLKADSGDVDLKSLSVDELDAKLQQAKAGQLKLFIYDTNSQARFKQSHIPTARWVIYDDVRQSDLPQDKEATLVFYCANEH